jgi:hypothetical protein
VEQNRQAVETLKRLGLGFRAGFIMIDPYTSVDEIKTNLEFTKDIGFYEKTNDNPLPFLQKLEIYRGTRIAETVEKDGLLVDKGFFLDYKYKHPEVAWLVRINTFLGNIYLLRRYIRIKFRDAVARLRGKG